MPLPGSNRATPDSREERSPQSKQVARQILPRLQAKQEPLLKYQRDRRGRAKPAQSPLEWSGFLPSFASVSYSFFSIDVSLQKHDRSPDWKSSFKIIDRCDNRLRTSSFQTITSLKRLNQIT